MSQTLLSSLQLALPLLFLAGALPSQHRWRRAVWLNATVSLLVLGIIAVQPVLQTMADNDHGLGVPTAAGEVIAVLVGFLGAIIARYSANFLRGETGRERFLTHLQMTLAGVVCVVLTGHMLILTIGWLVISLSLNRLLLFYPDRPRAVLAAHKKFLLARSAELLLLCAVVLLYSEYSTWQLSELRAQLTTQSPGLSGSIAALLLAMVALIKCAQLPVHGWLIQVVEAPTPVSALLHAGVINLGGYLLIAFAPLVEQVPAARWLVLIVAGITLVMAALIMGQQTSVKVRLAWSTSAQMGLMLVQCALGLYSLALLHLLAHACYKAYSFLSAGSAVELHSFRRMAGDMALTTGGVFAALAMAVVSVGLVAALFGPDGVVSPWLILLALITFTLFERGASRSGSSLTSAAALALVLMVAYVGQKLAMAALLPALEGELLAGADLWVSLLLLVMTTLFWLVRQQNRLPVARKFSGLLFAGFYLDEWFTRITLWLWPLQLPGRPHGKQIQESGKEAY